MRVASICDTCATYINAQCIIYNGDYLSAIGVSPLDSLDTILLEIDGTFPALQGVGNPTAIPSFVGQYYLNTSIPQLWIGLSNSIPNWGLLATISTTTTTSSTSTTTTTTTTP